MEPIRVIIIYKLIRLNSVSLLDTSGLSVGPSGETFELISFIKKKEKLILATTINNDSYYKYFFELRSNNILLCFFITIVPTQYNNIKVIAE